MTNVYKPAKKLDEQIEYLNQNKRVQFNEMDKELSKINCYNTTILM